MNFIVPTEIEQPNIAYNPTIQIPPHAIQKSHILSVKEFFLFSGVSLSYPNAHIWLNFFQKEYAYAISNMYHVCLHV